MRHFTPTRPKPNCPTPNYPTPISPTPICSLIAAVLLGSLLAGAPASAADLDAGYPDVPAALPQQTVSFGSGWYVRGDIAATELYGVEAARGTGNANQARLGRTHDVGYDLSLGGGYAFTNNIRGDIVADFQQPVQSKVFNTGCISSTATNCELIGKFDHYDALANIYYDFGTWSIVTPYIGAGAGVAFGKVGTNVLNDSVPYSGSRGYHNFAWALMAGAAFDVYAHTKIDVGYRFLNNGNVFGANVYNHEIRAGVRYMIDN